MAYTKTEWISKVTLVNAVRMNKIEDQLEILDTGKVDKDGNKVLSDNNFTDELKSKVECIDNIQNSVNSKVDKVEGKMLSSNDFTNELKQKVESIDNLNTNLNTKVDKVDGKELSSNDFTNDYKNKVDLIDDIQTTVQEVPELKVKIGQLESKEQVVTLESTSGNITLENGKIYRGNFDGDINFILPTINETDINFNQILVQAQISSNINIDFGTEYYFGDEYQNMEGICNFIFEHNGTNWIYGVVYIGGL